MNITCETKEALSIVTVNEGRIDASVVIAFKDKLREITEDGPDHIVLNLENVDFIDSSGLGAIVAAKKMVGSSRQLDLAGLTGAVDSVFKLTRMDNVFTIHGTVREALV